MKNAIPPSRMIAPAATRIAPLPLSPLSEGEVDVPLTAGVVFVDGIDAADWGTPGENGLVVPGSWETADEPVLDAASAPLAGTASASSTVISPASVRRTITACYRSWASGCSIAGVSGGVTYGFSESWTSSWYTLSTLTAQMSWSVPRRMLSTARIAVSIEWSELL